MSVKVEIDDGSGFCFGVVTAIRKAEEVLDKDGTLYCLGDIVHNSAEVERLRRRGLVTITHDELEKLHGVKVLLRAHGEPPSTYELARRNNIEIIDATCPVVLRLQSRIKNTFDHDSSNPQIVIYGKHGHAEVNGLVGQTDSKAIVAENIGELDAVDFSRPVTLYSQTTKSPEGFRLMAEEIKRRLPADVKFDYYDTICRQVSGRAEGLRKFAAAHDVVLFVSGAKSSNGKVLYGECLSVNSRTHLVSGPDAIQPEWLEGAKSIGVCGATSTPRWLMEQVRDRVGELI
ncbi:MAG: 4-hydroxy-3-methylbut-2-enyl diphosphate reductase [Barnesiella sp.]|nr:4-hydroxy-3-methylbut-2-enyl diphosphate reductase [Barnesiella sp.]MBD5374975.1 4-hydroxy-3-methylbut-2-enyl diphosphate reductase [Bacteroides sp.]